MADVEKAGIDPDFRRELAEHPGGDEISACFVCRTCTAGCPITQINNRFSPVRIIRLALMGLKKEVLTSDLIWLCSDCYTCQERCPHGVRVTDFMTVLKNLAVKEGYMPSGVKEQMKMIKSLGRIYPIDEFDNRKRTKAGLPSLPTSCEVVNELFLENKREDPREVD